MGLVHTRIKKSTHVYNLIYRWIFNAVGIFFCWRSWTSCSDTWHCGFHQISKYQNLTPSARNLIMGSGWYLHQDNDPKQTSKSTQKYVTQHKMKLLAWPSQTLWTQEPIWESEGSGEILHGGMISDLLSGVLQTHQAL